MGCTVRHGCRIGIVFLLFWLLKVFFFLDLDLDSERVEGPHISILSFNSIEGWILVFVQSLNAVKEAALESNRRTGAST